MASFSSRSRGSVTLILLGLMSVMIVFAFGLSRRMTGHSQILTIGDQSQLARYYLESYMGDVNRQIIIQANKPGSEIYQALRKNTRSSFKVIFPYKASDLLRNLGKKELDINVDEFPPEVEICDPKPLSFPDILIMPKALQEIEKRGILEIKCSIRFQKKKYSLDVRYPFVVTMRMTPMLREFLLFCDSLHLEQSKPFGKQDQINIIFTKESQIPKNPPPGYHGYAGRPLILWPSAGDKDKTGRVFLGGDDSPIYLNLAGEKSFRGDSGLMCDLWQVWPTWLKVNETGADFKQTPLFLDSNQKEVNVRGISIPLKLSSHQAQMGILGFSYEIADPNEGFFSDSSRTLEDFLDPDPSYKNMISDGKQYLALSSSIKLFGPNLESEMPDITYFGPNREVFGKVFGRFFLLTFFKPVSQSGGGTPLTYNPDPNYKPSLFSKYCEVQKVEFEPKNPQHIYSDFMSRVVSGGGDYSGNDAPEHYLAVNPESKKSKKSLSYAEFKPADGLQLGGRFDSFGESWFKILYEGSSRAPYDDIRVKSVHSRICREFANQDEFKKYAGINKNKFWVDGVVFVRGKLELDNIDTKDIRGGIVIVENGISLKNITRGISFTDEMAPQQMIDEVGKAVDTMSQDQILTFVSLRGETITLRGDKQIGVQLISLRSQLVGRPLDQIVWENPRRIVFCGGLAVSTLNMEHRIKEFARANYEPIFMFVPSMSDKNPSFSAHLMPSMEGYKLDTDDNPG